MKSESTDNDIDDHAAVRILDEEGVNLSEWEIEFLENCTRQVNSARGLTVRQRAKLWDIICERTNFCD